MLNHGAMAAELTAAIDRSRDDMGAIGIALIDLDNFRLLNDTHGHAAGDDALLRLARLVERHRPPRTTTGRFGPDEFLVIAPTASIAELRPAIEQLRHALVDESLQFGASERLPITISVGIATFAERRGLGDRAALGRHPRAGRGPRERRRRRTGRGPGTGPEPRRPGVQRAAVAGVHHRHQGPLHEAALGGRLAVRGLPGPPTRAGRGAGRGDPGRGAPARHRQGRDPRGHPAQARAAHGGRVRHRQAARGPGRRDRPRPGPPGPRSPRASAITTSGGTATATSTASAARRSRSWPASCPSGTPSRR